MTGNTAGSQKQESLLTCDILGNGLTLLLLRTERCQPRPWLRTDYQPWEVLLPYKKVKILLSSAAEDISLMLEGKFQRVPFRNMHNLAKLGRNEKHSSERWSTILQRLLWSTARNQKSQKMNDQRVEFHEGNKIWETNNSLCEQISQRDISGETCRRHYQKPWRSITAVAVHFPQAKFKTWTILKARVTDLAQHRMQLSTS